MNLTTFEWVAAVVIGVLSVARTARLVIFDDYPPMVWVRERLIAYTPERWTGLWQCPFCLAPYMVAVMIAWAWISDLHWTWWVINGWWAASYVAAIVVAYDQPDD